MGEPRRFRFLIGLGSLSMLASGVLPWWRAGGESVNGVWIPGVTGIGLEGPGIVIFGVAVGVLAVLDIGYLRGRHGFILDSPPVYVLLGVVAALALAVRGWQLWSVGYLPVPERSPGLAVAAAGVGALLFGAGSWLATPRRPTLHG
jgi:hypothetical protein